MVPPFIAILFLSWMLIDYLFFSELFLFMCSRPELTGHYFMIFFSGWWYNTIIAQASMHILRFLFWVFPERNRLDCDVSLVYITINKSPEPLVTNEPIWVMQTSKRDGRFFYWKVTVVHCSTEMHSNLSLTTDASVGTSQ